MKKSNKGFFCKFFSFFYKDNFSNSYDHQLIIKIGGTK